MTSDAGHNAEKIPRSAKSVTCNIVCGHIGDIDVVAVSGTIDVQTAPDLEAAITTTAQNSATAIVVDLTAVDFLASAGMGVLISARGGLGPSVRLAVVADGPVTARPLKLVGVDKVVDVFATLDEARTALGR